MGKRGPRKIPTNLRLLSGEHRPSQVNYNEPIAPDEGLICPDDASDEVKAIWDETVAYLESMKMARTPDRYALRCYCEAVVNYRRAANLVAQSPPLIKGGRGNLVTNPAWRVERECSRTILRWAQEFGFTPSARSSIVAGRRQDDDDNPFASVGT